LFEEATLFYEVFHHIVGNVVISNACRNKGAYLPGLWIDSVHQIDFFLVLLDEFLNSSKILVSNVNFEFIVNILDLRLGKFFVRDHFFFFNASRLIHFRIYNKKII